MAKKSSRVKLGLVCGVCNTQNYVIEKNKINTTVAIKIKKFCSKCNKHTDHKEKKKLG
ncbi:50S ribosomal protein L33 [Candidatus Roizmanbacteria bacterium RIFCSPLOWO2_01_FULL_41_22]|uniref:Large ribosomal subunit protein bL33 n=2 Tax=Candidatus Roizmaniibacteriota TaxID=1752723 RepID=A0A1F7JQ31_9BACT|nr:MAG: 50S ribosomal protein L33 [Candidatus Roizmanbacteria bacterium RIFCSPLOWO2_01_FULL_41_22]OGK57712.1 MAG: 50S ribosomal protein L33 [Candidatus Roizmanbacteria bacterium RIFCSPLOWO2_02_FULL_41_9]